MNISSKKKTLFNKFKDTGSVHSKIRKTEFGRNKRKFFLENICSETCCTRNKLQPHENSENQKKKNENVFVLNFCRIQELHEENKAAHVYGRNTA